MEHIKLFLFQGGVNAISAGILVKDQVTRIGSSASACLYSNGLLNYTGETRMSVFLECIGDWAHSSGQILEEAAQVTQPTQRGK